jgi:hypothetical protein
MRAHLQVDVRRVSGDAAWEWRRIDVRDASVFQREFPYESAAKAQKAGLARLAELASPGLAWTCPAHEDCD